MTKEQSKKDIEKVTDHVEEVEFNQNKSTDLNFLSQIPAQKSASKGEKIQLKKDEVEYMMREWDISKQKAEQLLRQHQGQPLLASRHLLVE